MKETLESSNSAAGTTPAAGDKCKLSMISVANNSKLANVGHVLQDGEARSDDVSIQEDVHFSDMYLNDDVLAGLQSTGFYRPSPVQLQAIPTGRCGLDLIVQAKSGTGKTCVFTVLALEMVAASATTTQVLVIAPTREIAVQIAGVMTSVGRHIKGLKVGVFIGGTAVETPGVCHIAVGTPGRLHHMLTDAKLCGRNIRLLVLDEADQMLDSFRNEVQQIVASLPHSKQVVCASATYTPPLQELAKKLMRSPVHVTLGSKQLLAVTQYIHKLPYTGTSNQAFRSKLLHLKGILGSATFNQCLIFTNSIMKAESVCDSLRSDGWPVACLCGGQTQKQRLQALDDLVTHRCRVLVATDLAARGLDSPHVSLVVSLEAPLHPHTYLHRVGRAGRFGAQGVSVVLAQQGDDWLYVQAIATMLDLNVLVLPEPSLQDLHQWQETLPHLTKDQLQQWASSTNRKLEAWKMDGVRPKLVENGIKVIDTAVQSNGTTQNNTETVVTIKDPSKDDEAVPDLTESNLITKDEVNDSRFVSPEAAVLTELISDLKLRDDSSKKDEIVELLKVTIGSSEMVKFSREEYLKELLEMGEGGIETKSRGVANTSPGLRDLSLSEQRVVRNCLDATDAARKARTAAVDAAWSSLPRDARHELRARARGQATAAPVSVARKSVEKEAREEPQSGKCEAVEDCGLAVKDDFSFHIKVMNEEKKLNKEQTKKFSLSKSNGDNIKEESVKTKTTNGKRVAQKKSKIGESLLGGEEKYEYNDYNYDEYDEFYWSEDSVERDEYGDPLADRSHRSKPRKESQEYNDYHTPSAGQHGHYSNQYHCSDAPYDACGHSNTHSSEYYGYNNYYDAQTTSRPPKADCKRRSANRKSEVPKEEEPFNDGNYDHCLPGYPDQAQQEGKPWNSFQPLVLLDRSKEPKAKKDETASVVTTRTKKPEKLARGEAENLLSLEKGFQSGNGKGESSNSVKRGARKRENLRVNALYDGHSIDATKSKSDRTQTKIKCEHPGCSSSVSSSCSSEESDEEVGENYNYFDGYKSGNYYGNDRRPSSRDFPNSSRNKSKGNNKKGHCQGCCCGDGGHYPGSLSYLSSLYQFTMMDSFVRAMGRASTLVAQQMRRDQASWQCQWGPSPATDQRRRRPRAGEGDATHSPCRPGSARQRRGAHQNDSSADCSRESGGVRKRCPRTPPAVSQNKPRSSDSGTVAAVTVEPAVAVTAADSQFKRAVVVTANNGHSKSAVAVTASDGHSKPAVAVTSSDGHSKPAVAVTASDSHSKPAVTVTASDGHSKPAVAVTANDRHSKPAVVQSRKKARKKQNKAK